MGPERWQRLVSLFHVLHDKSEPERVLLLERTRATDPDLARELERMLEEEGLNDDFLENPPLPVGRQIGRDIQPDDTIGHYRILSLLGSGGMGVVYRAQDTRLNRVVALKFLAPHLVGYGKDREQFFQEAQAAAALLHPNVCPVYEISDDRVHTFIAMAYLEGESLAQRIANGPLPVREAVGLAIDIASALQASHAKGIIHHDVKPANLMVNAGSDQQNHATLTDFGLAQMAERSRTGEGGLAGTISYMSPERISGAPVDHRADLWSLGVVLFEMLAGRKPFPGTADRSVPDAIVRIEPAPLSDFRPDVPVELEGIVRRALAKEPDRRYGAAAELMRDLRQVALKLEASEVDGRRPPLWSPQRYTRRSKLLIAAVTLLAAAGAWYAWKLSTPPKDLLLHQLTMQISDNRVTAAAVSPNGKLLAYATTDGVFLQVIAGGDVQLLPSPKDVWVDRIRWFPDAERLAIGGFSRTSAQPGVWTVSLHGAAPVFLRGDARDPQPSADGSRLAFTNGDRSEIWVANTNGQEARRVLERQHGRLFLLFWSADATHVAFARTLTVIADATQDQRHFASPIVDSHYECIEVRTGKIDVRLPELLIASAAMLRHGKAVFLRGKTTNRPAGNDLWQMDTDPHTAAPIGRPRRFAIRTDAVERLLQRRSGDSSDDIYDLSISTDGHAVTVVRSTSFPTVYVADYSPDPPRLSTLRHLTLETSSSFPHSWTLDSRAVVFDSDRRGNNDLFRQNLDSRLAESITATPWEDFQANLSPDGRWFLFMQAPLGKMLPATVARVPTEGGTPEQVAPSGSVDEFRCALPGGKRCVARRTEGQEWYTFYDLDPTAGLGRELARTRWMWSLYGDWALSPDGGEVALPEHTPNTTRIRIVSLDRKSGPVSEEVVVSGLSDINGLNWSADGRGWFAVVNTAFGTQQLMYVDRRGRARPLMDGAGYAIPSPDGKRVALMIPSVSSNVWSLEGL